MRSDIRDALGVNRIKFFDPLSQRNVIDDVLNNPDDPSAIRNVINFIRTNPDLVEPALYTLEKLWEQNPLSAPRSEGLAKLYSMTGDKRADYYQERAHNLGGAMTTPAASQWHENFSYHDVDTPPTALWRDGTPYYVFDFR